MTAENTAIDMDTEFYERLRSRAKQVDTLLLRYLGEAQVGGQFREVLEYAVVAPGKRIRAVLLLWTCELITGQPARTQVEVAAVALEMVHTYSLIHDDLPAMDDDDFRRGRPTCHKAFDEAMAILAGDGLLTLAFELLADQVKPPVLAVSLIKALARCAGPDGMIAGQVADLKAEKTPTDLQGLQYIHVNKTAKMFQCATVMGALCGGATQEEVRLLGEYGLKIGLGFQIADDILDVSASTEQLGKTAGKDEKAGKTTYPALLGMDRAREQLNALTQDAVDILAPFGNQAEFLRQLALVLLTRTR
ncbi:MAG: polyprenyl synthetase family protein [Phycisphaerae bacterium]|nr:polyprenyl synthetase family protein [Phycisphaerae bacterium]